MSKLLRGNFSTKKEVEGESKGHDVTEEFEKEALRRLGGSIAYVSKKKFVWSGEDSEATSPGESNES